MFTLYNSLYKQRGKSYEISPKRDKTLRRVIFNYYYFFLFPLQEQIAWLRFMLFMIVQSTRLRLVTRLVLLIIYFCTRYFLAFPLMPCYIRRLLYKSKIFCDDWISSTKAGMEFKHFNLGNATTVFQDNKCNRSKGTLVKLTR